MAHVTIMGAWEDARLIVQICLSYVGFRRDMHDHKYWLNNVGFGSNVFFLILIDYIHQLNWICQWLCPLGAFDDEDIIHVEGNVDPVRDIEIIHEELRLKDEEMIGPVIDKLEKTAVRGSDKKLKPEYVRKMCAGMCYAAVW